MRGDINFKGSDLSDLSVYFLFCGGVAQIIFIFTFILDLLIFTIYKLFKMAVKRLWRG